jgi:hypothetical protein
MTEFAIAALPLLALLASLLFGRYPGCEAALRLADRLASRPRTSAPAAGSSPRPRPPALRAPHGGLLVALGLAQRPPPFAT